MADRSAELDSVPFRLVPASGTQPLWREVLGDEFRRLRRGRGETLTETSARAGVSPQYLSEMERGLKEPSSEMIAAVAGALGTNLGELTRSISADLTPAPRSSVPGPSVSVRLSGARYSGYLLAA